MPNPLTLMTPTQTAAAKPGTRESTPETSTRFQDILEEETPQPETEDEAVVEQDIVPEDSALEEVLGHPLPVKPDAPEEQVFEDLAALPVPSATQVPQGSETAPGSSKIEGAEAPKTDSGAMQQVSIAPPPRPEVENTHNSAVQPQPTTIQPEPTKASDSQALPAKPIAGPPVPVERAQPSASVLSAETAAALQTNAAPTTPQPPRPTPTLAQMQVMASVRNADAETATAIRETDGVIATREEPLFQNVRDTASAAQPATQAARAEITRAIAGQMAAAIQVRTGSGAIEIALSPEELGRVSITLNGREDGMVLTIAAERPETLDLMRRHLAVLEAEFQSLGYGDISFDLSTSDDAQDDTANPKASDYGLSHSAESDTPSAPVIPRNLSGRGIDMRL
ncbi:flagellar hook-length control protein FliK [Ruegeria sp. R13_0]|uniref:flagellar hook-length control protein FliK n=1 Tax=Ruegeria sp. R13_0 TaxID=2821099 RepID=UPI001ADA6F02|nr:flagellar hook-length control protein FliK [Ruegeria sp. R13_0]MBO9434763.1 flagellar hook-length control protein FliK [Ruegeria sp. R13_0]